MYNYVWYHCTFPYGLSLNGWHALLCIANNRHDVTITTHAVKRDYLIWMTTVRQPTKRWRSRVGDKTIPDLAEPRLESFSPPFVAGIDLPHQGVVDSYSLVHPGVQDKRSAGCLRSIYPSLGMRQLFRDVTMGRWRHNQPTELSEFL